MSRKHIELFFRLTVVKFKKTKMNQEAAILCFLTECRGNIKESEFATFGNKTPSYPYTQNKRFSKEKMAYGQRVQDSLLRPQKM